jgi:hypothetical protein
MQRGFAVEGNEMASQSDLNAYERAVVDGVTRLVHARLRAAAGGAAASDLGDPDKVAERMAAVLPTPEPYDSVCGPFYDTAGLVTWLGLSRQAVHHRAKAGLVLGCKTADGRTVYPAWQFTEEGATIPYLAEVLGVLRAGTDSPWTHALWLGAPANDLDGSTPAEWLTAGNDPARVLAAARADAARWAA